MDPSELVQQVLVQLAPLVAQGALAKIGEDTTDRVTALVGRAWRLLSGAGRGNPKAEAALTVYEEDPNDARNIERLARHLAEYLKQQHQAIDELREIAAQLQPLPAQVSFTSNAPNYGMQAGVVHGGMTQHGAPRPPDERE